MQPEAAYLLARCELILDAVEAFDPTPLLAQMRGIARTAAATNNVRALRTVRRDLLEISQILPPDQRATLEAALRLQESDDPIHRAG